MQLTIQKIRTRSIGQSIITLKKRETTKWQSQKISARKWVEVFFIGHRHDERLATSFSLICKEVRFCCTSGPKIEVLRGLSHPEIASESNFAALLPSLTWCSVWTIWNSSSQVVDDSVRSSEYNQFRIWLSAISPLYISFNH